MALKIKNGEFDPDDPYAGSDSYYNSGSLYGNTGDPYAPVDSAPQDTTPGATVAAQQGAPAASQAATPAAAAPAWSSPWGTGTPDAGGFATPQFTADNFGNAPGGYDPVKWTDPLHQTPKYVAGRIYQSGKQAGLPLDQIVANIQRAYPGTTWNGRDVINVPGIGNVDFVTDFGPTSASGNIVAWQPLDGLSAANGLQTSAIGQNTTAQGQGGGTNYANPTQMDPALRAAILQLLSTSQDVDPETLYKSPEARAQRLGAQRGAERERAQFAEHSAFEGTSDSGAFDSGVQGINQARGESEATFLGMLASRKMQENRAALVSGIQFAMQAGQFSEAQAMQRELAMLDAALRREGLGLGYDQLEYQMNRDSTLAGLGG